MGKITHTGYVSDDSGRILPWWPNKADPNCPDPYKMAYGSVRRPTPSLNPQSQNQRPDIEGMYPFQIFLDSTNTRIHPK